MTHSRITRALLAWLIAALCLLLLPAAAPAHATNKWRLVNTVIVSAPSGDTISTTATIVLGPDQGCGWPRNTLIHVTLDGVAQPDIDPPNSGTVTLVYQGLSPGPHQFTAASDDSVGDLQSPPAQVDWNVL